MRLISLFVNRVDLPVCCILSSPIEVVSRGHRLPKPYGPVTSPGCDPDPSHVSWETRDTAKESLSRHGLWFKLTRVYLQPIGDIAIMAMACDGVHIRALWLFWAMLAFVGMLATMGYAGMRWNCDRGASRYGGWSALLNGLKLLCLSWNPPLGSGVRSRAVSHLTLGTLGLVAVQFLAFYIASNIR